MLEEVVFEDGCLLKSIGGSAFNGCKKLKTIELPMGTTEVLSLAFGGCETLKLLVIPSSVVTVGPSAFGGCTSLSTARVCVQRESSNTIDKTAFGGCSNLLYVSVPTTFIGSELGGKKVFRILDAECNVPTFHFTELLTGSNEVFVGIAMQFLCSHEHSVEQITESVLE